MEYKVEELSPSRRAIKVDVPAEEVNASLSATVALYRRGADIKGFRKGKVPSSVVEARFRKQIYGEATSDSGDGSLQGRAALSGGGNVSVAGCELGQVLHKQRT